MENRLNRVREILNSLVDQNGAAPYHSGKGRFWNLSRDVFVNGPVAGRKPYPMEWDNQAAGTNPLRRVESPNFGRYLHV